MTPDLLRQAADSNQWWAIAPELMLAGTALLLLVLELCLPKKEHHVIPLFALLGLAGTIFGLTLHFDSAFLTGDLEFPFGGLLHLTKTGQFLRMFFLVSSALVTLLGTVSLARQRLPRVEFFHITLIVTAAMMLLVQANNFILLFVALETVTIGFYILVSYFRTSPRSLEAGLKYLILGALSSAILLFGIVLLYGAAGNHELLSATATPMDFRSLGAFLAANPHDFLAKTGIVLVLAGVAFKIGAVPFQIWIPDVYQGAPTPVTAFLAVSSKAAGFAVLLTLTAVFAPCRQLVLPVLVAMAAATIIFGNLAALTQSNVKRLMGLSGVSHAGYLLLGVAAACTQPQAVGAIFFYLLVYLLGSFAVFGVMTHLAGADDADQELAHYAGLGRSNPLLAGVLAVGLGSLAGIPPLAGFVGKFAIFFAVFHAGLYWPLAIALGGVIISIYYYFGWIRAAFFTASAAPGTEAEATAPMRVSLAAGAVLLALALGSVWLGFHPGALGEWVLALGN